MRNINSAHKRSATRLGLDASWMAKAECKHQGFDEPHRKRNIDMFFSERNHRKITNARRMCAGCSVRSECLQYALRVPFDNGVWGGLTPIERIRVRRGEGTPDHFWSEVTS